MESDLEQDDFTPLSPAQVLENEGKVALHSDGYFFRLPKECLEGVTEDDIRESLGLSAKERVFLRDIQDTPTEDTLSPEFLRWSREWWKQSATELRQLVPMSIDPGHRGPISDKRLYEQSAVETQFPDADKQADLGYLGLPTVLTPHKKPKGGERTEEQKEENRQFASARVRVEHGIRRLKGFGILRDPYRLATGLFPMIASATAGLVQLQRLVG